MRDVDDYKRWMTENSDPDPTVMAYRVRDLVLDEVESSERFRGLRQGLALITAAAAAVALVMSLLGVLKENAAVDRCDERVAEQAAWSQEHIDQIQRHADTVSYTLAETRQALERAKDRKAVLDEHVRAITEALK